MKAYVVKETLLFWRMRRDAAWYNAPVLCCKEPGIRTRERSAKRAEYAIVTTCQATDEYAPSAKRRLEHLS